MQTHENGIQTGSGFCTIFVFSFEWNESGMRKNNRDCWQYFIKHRTKSSRSSVCYCLFWHAERAKRNEWVRERRMFMDKTVIVYAILGTNNEDKVKNSNEVSFQLSRLAQYNFSFCCIVTKNSLGAAAHSTHIKQFFVFPHDWERESSSSFRDKFCARVWIMAEREKCLLCTKKYIVMVCAGRRWWYFNEWILCSAQRWNALK